MTKDLDFLEARGDTVNNLQAIQMYLLRCVDQGMLDLEDQYYNQLISLIDEASISQNWAELMEVIAKAKVLEIDAAVWLSIHGQTSISLPWPRPPAPKQGK